MKNRAELALYIRKIMGSAGYTSQAALARDLRVEASRVSHWLDETGRGRGLSAHNLLEIIRACEKKSEPASGAPSRQAEDQPAQVPSQTLQGGIEAAVAAISKEMRAGFRKIDRRLQGLEQQRTPEDGQSPPKAAEA